MKRLPRKPFAACASGGVRRRVHMSALCACGKQDDSDEAMAGCRVLRLPATAQHGPAAARRRGRPAAGAAYR